MGMIGIGLFAAIFVVLFELRRQRTESWSSYGTLRPVEMQAGPLGYDPAWLSLDADMLRRVRRAVWLLGAYTVVTMGLLLYLVRDLRLDTPPGRFHAFVTGVMFILVLLISVLGAVNLGRLPRRRIGVTRDEVWYDPGSGEVIRSRWDEVRVSTRTVLIGRQLVELIDKRSRYLYPRPELESRLLGRLPATAFLSNWKLLFEALRRGNVALWMTAVATGLYLAFTLLRWSQPALVNGLGAQFVDLFR